MNVIILGHTGFIGSNIYKFLLKNSIFNLVGASSNICNLLSAKKTKKFFFNKNNFILIFCSSIVRTKGDSIANYYKNIRMMENVTKALLKKKVIKIIYLSSVDVYKISQKKITEKSPVCPNTHYGRSKLVSEKILLNNFPRKNVILRIPGIYSSALKETNALSFYKKKILKKKIKINSSGNEYRDYLNIASLVRAVNFFITNKVKGTFNLSSGKSYKVKKIIDMMSLQILGRRIKLESDNKIIKNNIFIDIAKFKKATKNMKIEDLKEGIKKISNYAKNI